jgi:hypothetical protein
MRSHRSSLLAMLAFAALTQSGGGPALEYSYRTVKDEPPPNPDQRKRWRDQRGYPQTGTGKRQGERVARQMRRSLGNPFAASDKCIERIKARISSHN